MPSVGFELVRAVIKRLQNYILDRRATGIGNFTLFKIICWPCIEQLGMVRKPNARCALVQHFCNISVYPTFVMHFPEDGHKSDQNMYTVCMI